MPASPAHQVPFLSARSVGTRLSISHTTTGEKLSGIAQYASNAYVQRLESIGAVLSMSRPGRPWENGQCESFLKTLKLEEIDARPYRTMDELEEHLAEFIEQIYNKVRLHSALGYLSPEEFEARLVQPGIQSAWLPAGLRLRRHEEIPPVPQDGSGSA